MIEICLHRIRAFRHEKGWSKNRLARETGLRESTIRAMDSADWSPTADTVRALERVIPDDFEAKDAAA
jgi:ribosome-binding protein aMBF1 (putative translation factor)